MKKKKTWPTIIFTQWQASYLGLLRTGWQTAFAQLHIKCFRKMLNHSDFLAGSWAGRLQHPTVPSLNQTLVRWAWPCASWCRCCSPGPAAAPPPSLCPSPPPSAGWPETAAGWPETAAGWTEMAAGCASWTAYRTEYRPPTAESDRSKLGKIQMRLDTVDEDYRYYG